MAEYSVATENPSSSSHAASIIVSIISDPVTLAADSNYTVLEDVSEITEADAS